MDERRANIDLAFRNGLKDYEVLPPPDVWNRIDNRIKRKSRPAYLLRAAASFAIVLSLSVLAYRWAARNPALRENPEFAVNEESSFSQPVQNVSRAVTPPRVAVNSNINNNSPVTEIFAIEPDASVEINEQELLKRPEINIQLPVDPGLYSIVHPETDFARVQNKKFTVGAPAPDNINKQYQDFLVEDNSTPNTYGSRWSISALATPTYYGKFNSGSDELSKQIMASEKAVVSYSGGMALTYKLNRRLSIQSGLFYSSVGQNVDGINSFAGFQRYNNAKGGPSFEVLTTNGTIYTSNPDVFLMANGNSNRIITNYNNDVFDPQKASLDYINNNIRQSFSYLELPVFLRYKLIDRAVAFNLIGGLSYNLLVGNSVYTVIDGNKYMIGTTSGMNMLSISSSVGMGMEYKFSNKISLNLEPTFRYYMNTFSTTSGSNFHPYSFGVFSGLSFKF